MLENHQKNRFPNENINLQFTIFGNFSANIQMHDYFSIFGAKIQTDDFSNFCAKIQIRDYEKNQGKNQYN